MGVRFVPKKIAVALALAVTGSALLVACGGDDGDSGINNSIAQPVLSAKTKSILTVDGKQFKDLNANGQLDQYEDWRRSIDQRVDDLVARMTLEEKAGLMLIQTLNSDCAGAVGQLAFDYINTQKMTRFIFRNVVHGTPTCTASGGQVSPENAAKFTNAVQAMRESTRLGVPALFKSNARNHYEKDPRFGISEAAGAFTEFPKEAGIAAAALGEEFVKTGKTTVGDAELIRKFAQVMGAEWKSIGLRGMYGYMADLATEPRWYRVHETFTEDADLNANIMKTLVETLQGGPLNPNSSVALTMKHFPGGGPQELGLDPHYAHGKNQVYPAGMFEYHLKPFMAAINAGVSSIMPYYGVPIDVTYKGVKYEQTGFAFSKQVVTDLLRGELGFKGYVNSDTGIINDRAWGLEKKTVPERVAAAINGGTDTLSGFNDVKTITDLVKAGLLSEARVTEAAKRLLKPLFEMGLFENPYVDAAQATTTIGKADHLAVGMDVQRKSIALLQNAQQDDGSKVLPLKAGSKLYVMGMAKSDVEKYGYTVTDGEAKLGDGSYADAGGHDYAVIRVEVSTNKLVPGTTNKATASYQSNGPVDGLYSGLNPSFINPILGVTWGSYDRCVSPQNYSDGAGAACLDNGLRFGGSLPWEANNLSFTKMAESNSWLISPSLERIKEVMGQVGAKKTVLSIYFRNPYVLDEASGLRNAGAIVAGFGVSNTALLDILSGKILATGAAVKPQGKLPFALANNLQAVIDNDSDAPGYPAQDTLFPYGHGLTY